MKQQFLVAQIIWGAMAVSVVVYILVSFQMNHGRVSDVGLLELISGNKTAMILCLDAVFMLGLHFFIPSLIFKQAALKTEANKNLLEKMGSLKSNQGTPIWTPEKLNKISALPVEEILLMYLFPNWFGSFVIRMAFAESIVIHGLIISNLSHDFRLILPFAGLTLILFALRFPRPESYVDEVKKIRASKVI